MAPIRCCFDQTAVWHSDAARGPSTPSFDHLVGDGEHAWAHFEAERPCRLKIDDELEPRRLQHRQIGRLGAFKDAASVHADLTTHLELIGSVAHQSAGGNIAPLRVTGWYPLASGQDRKLHTAAAEESVGPDKGSIDLANGGGLEYPKLKPDDRGGLLQVPQCVLGGRRIGRIDKHGNTSSRGDQLMQEPQPLGCHLFGEKINSRRIAPRTGKAGHKTKLDRIPRDTEHDWDRRSYRFGRASCGPAAGDSDHRHWATNQIGHQCRQPIVLALQPVVLDSDVLPFDVAGFLKTVTERGHITRSDFRSPRVKKLDHRHRRLLPPRAPYLDREQQATATNQCDELTPLHVRHGDFLPYALFSAADRPIRSIFRHLSLPQRGRLVLGADMNRSESRRWPAPQSASSQTRIAHGEWLDGHVEEDRRIRP